MAKNVSCVSLLFSGSLQLDDDSADEMFSEYEGEYIYQGEANDKPYFKHVSTSFYLFSGVTNTMQDSSADDDYSHSYTTDDYLTKSYENFWFLGPAVQSSFYPSGKAETSNGYYYDDSNFGLPWRIDVGYNKWWPDVSPSTFDFLPIVKS